MLVPGFLYGRFRDVKAACRRKVTQIKRGATWNELADDLVDTRDHQGLFVLDGPSPLLGGGEHFHFFALGYAIRKEVYHRLSEDVFETLFEPAIATNWGFLTMLSAWARAFLRRPGHQQRLLHLLIRWWDELDAAGARYTKGANYGHPLWQVVSNIHYCLVREGLPEELAKQPVPPGGIAALVAQTRAGLPPKPPKPHEMH